MKLTNAILYAIAEDMRRQTEEWNRKHSLTADFVPFEPAPVEADDDAPQVVVQPAPRATLH